MLKSKPYSDEKLQGVIYTFEFINDEIPEHVHGAADNHITIVISGSIFVSGDSWNTTGLPGTILSFSEGSAHKIVAKSENTVILNLLKNPAGV